MHWIRLNRLIDCGNVDQNIKYTYSRCTYRFTYRLNYYNRRFEELNRIKVKMLYSNRINIIYTHVSLVIIFTRYAKGESGKCQRAQATTKFLCNIYIYYVYLNRTLRCNDGMEKKNLLYLFQAETLKHY